MVFSYNLGNGKKDSEFFFFLAPAGAVLMNKRETSSP